MKRDALKDILNWIDANSTTITEEEARIESQKHIVKPSFSLVLSKDDVALPKEMKAVPDLNHLDAVQMMPTNRLFELHAKKKEFLPAYTFCIDNMVHAMVLDIECGMEISTIVEAMGNVTYIAYYSSNSMIGKPRLRIIAPLTEPIPADVYDYCKLRLMGIFDSVPDPHSFEHKRFFYMPSKLTGEFREENHVYHHYGKAIDFYATTGFSGKDKLDMKMKEIRKQVSEKNVSDDERVRYYLDTPFPMIRGNGDSASSFYTAICVCLAHNDEETLEEVLEKARDEKWTEKEIERYIKGANKFVTKE